MFRYETAAPVMEIKIHDSTGGVGITRMVS